MSGKKSIFIVNYGGGHVQLTIPVIKLLKDDERFKVNVFGLTSSRTLLDKHRIDYFAFADLVKTGDDEALAYGEELAADLPGDSPVPLEESIAYLGLSFLDLVRELGEKEARRRYDYMGRRAFTPRTALERAFALVKPDVVVATNSPRAERTSMLLAKEKSIPSVCIVDLFGVREMPWVGAKNYSSKVCVLSEHVKKLMLAAGRSDEEIIVSGNPAFDRLADPALKAAAEKKRSERGWTNKKVVLFASQITPKAPTLPREISEHLFSLSQKQDDLHVVIRPHPNEELNFDNIPPTATISGKEDPLPELLHSVDLVMTMTSTVGFEAVLIGKPLIALEMGIQSQFAPYSEMELAIGVNNLADLEQAIFKATESTLVDPSTLPELGRAAESVAEVIKQAAG
ncbi:hypothetical protein BVY02_00235 [bacterium J17]|nr:hypothetical protein BVY02_00235 [bacterium J17]